MAFLDNSGDIILDAVLTDTGRFRLARGDFKISSFALGDDEIDYSLYNKDHASGSAYYDLEILQTPVLEAFTNNTSSLKSRLISVPRNNLLYLPVIKLNESAEVKTRMHTSGTFLVAVNLDTEQNEGYTTVGNTKVATQGVMWGENIGSPNTIIQLDQGLDTTEISPSFGIDADLKESQYIVEIDNRLGTIVNPVTYVRATPSFIDDDDIATYFFDFNTDPDFITEITETRTSTEVPAETIQGPRGTRIKFYIAASLDLNTGTYLFERLGGSNTVTVNNSNYYIDTTVKVTGGQTGYRVDVPVRFIRKV